MFPASLVASPSPAPLATPGATGVLVHWFTALAGPSPIPPAAPSPIIMISAVLVSRGTMVWTHQWPRCSATTAAAEHSCSGSGLLLPRRPAVPGLVLVCRRRWGTFSELGHEGHVLFINLGLLRSVRSSEVAAATTATAAETLSGPLHDAILGDVTNATTTLEEKKIIRVWPWRSKLEYFHLNPIACFQRLAKEKSAMSYIMD